MSYVRPNSDNMTSLSQTAELVSLLPLVHRVGQIFSQGLIPQPKERELSSLDNIENINVEFMS